MKDIEQKQMLGQRESDDDGFTYRYGAHKGGYVKRPRHNNTIATCRRADKRSVRAASTRRAFAESV
uniref:hypothetical protein n=1 Tax=uncultured Pseudacidovorax sp. TaxID=679313 RepID=UPI0025FB885F|nr:hypothetical protein [uncultured Pseudacidovorax sp.]